MAASVPLIDRDALIQAIAARLPGAAVETEDINPDYGSWRLQVSLGSKRADISWGPLSGFGATDVNNFREDSNPFGAFDWPMESVNAAVEFVAKVLEN